MTREHHYWQLRQIESPPANRWTLFVCGSSVRYFDIAKIFVTVIEDFTAFFFKSFTAMSYPFLESRKENEEGYPGNLQPVVGADDKEDRRSKKSSTDKKRSPDKLYGGR